MAAKLLPGDYYVTRDNELVTTVLGSCIAACIRDTVEGIGGMNHFMLPEQLLNTLSCGSDDAAGNATRYGNVAMEHLINAILQHGGRRQNLEVKLFGGGNILPNLCDIGKRNIQFVLDYIDTEALKLVSSDLGDIYPRKINFYPKTGSVRMKKLKDLCNDTVINREFRYQTRIKNTPVAGEVELF